MQNKMNLLYHLHNKQIILLGPILAIFPTSNDQHFGGKDRASRNLSLI